MNSPDMNPFMYQDLISSNNGMLPSFGLPVTTGMYPTNMLGGMRLAAQPYGDKFLVMKQKDKEERNAFWTSLAVLAGIGTATAMLFKGGFNFKAMGRAISAPVKKAGKSTKSACVAAGSKSTSFLGRVGNKIKSGFKTFGHLITMPFKALGKGFKKLGNWVAAPFRAIKKGFNKIFKHGQKSENPQIKGLLEPPKHTEPKPEVLVPDKIIMPDK